MALIETPDPEDTAAFHETVRRALEQGTVTEAHLAHAMNASRTSIKRWQEGRNAPHPAMRPGVYAFLRKSALYHACWSILVQHTGVREDGREAFMQAALDPWRPFTEYRFQGSLGFGGKFWRYDGRLYCTCYPEDETKERLATIAKVNQLLAGITPKDL